MWEWSGWIQRIKARTGLRSGTSSSWANINTYTTRKLKKLIIIKKHFCLNTCVCVHGALWWTGVLFNWQNPMLTHTRLTVINVKPYISGLQGDSSTFCTACYYYFNTILYSNCPEEFNFLTFFFLMVLTLRVSVIPIV